MTFPPYPFSRIAPDPDGGAVAFVYSASHFGERSIVVFICLPQSPDATIGITVCECLMKGKTVTYTAHDGPELDLVDDATRRLAAYLDS